jgi:hypothetical protein
VGARSEERETRTEVCWRNGNSSRWLLLRRDVGVLQPAPGEDSFSLSFVVCVLRLWLLQ